MFSPSRPRASGLFQGGTEMVQRQRVFIADVNVAVPGTHRVSAYDHAFKHKVGVAFKDTPVLKAAGVAFVSIADKIPGVSRCLPAVFPLFPGREAAASAPTQA
jgi:hypothetical protein